MVNKLSLSVLIAAFAIADAREIRFPSLSGFSSDQAVMGIISPDITQAKFGGLATYANLPYVHCLAPEGEEVEKFDIAVLGAPFDTVSHLKFPKMLWDGLRR
jgi:agmatinase